LIGSDHLTKIFRVHSRRQLSRKINKHHCHLTAFSGVGGGCVFVRQNRKRPSFGSLTAQKGDRVKQLAAVSDTIDTEVFQILRRQVRQDLFVNLVFAKCRCIALEAEALQPSCEFHNVARM